MTKQPKYPGSVSNVDKGRMVESIVASMHERPNVRVERNVKLPPISGVGKQKREIDVLLSSEVVGYPVRWAIECKNEAKRIGSEYIDAFVGKLTYVGIPPEFGIFVSASGYTKGAIERAKSARMRILTLNDALRDLDATIVRAVQTIVYLLPVLNTIQVETFYHEEIDFGEAQALFNEEGGVSPIPDLAWQAWMTEGFIPSSIGMHEVGVDCSKPVFLKLKGELVRITKCIMMLEIRGLIQQLSGQVSQYHLRNATDDRLEKARISAQFEPLSPGNHNLITIASEEELQEFVRKEAIVKITQRIRLPRVNYWHTFYWPPSDRVLRLIAERMQAFESGQIADPRPFNISELEGTDISAVFEQISTSYLVGAVSPKGD